MCSFLAKTIVEGSAGLKARILKDLRKKANGDCWRVQIFSPPTGFHGLPGRIRLFWTIKFFQLPIHNRGLDVWSLGLSARPFLPFCPHKWKIIKYVAIAPNLNVLGYLEQIYIFGHVKWRFISWNHSQRLKFQSSIEMLLFRLNIFILRDVSCLKWHQNRG